jgi:hypothetical protein
MAPATAPIVAPRAAHFDWFELFGLALRNLLRVVKAKEDSPITNTTYEISIIGDSENIRLNIDKNAININISSISNILLPYMHNAQSSGER